MSVVSENAIVISATIDTSGVTNGVERINQAVSGVQKAADGFYTNLTLPAGSAGEKAGDSFLSGMASRILGSMLIRDAIRGVLYTIQESLTEFLGNEAYLSGGTSKGFHPLKALGDFIGDALSAGAEMIPALNRAHQALGASGIGAANAKNLSDSDLQRFKEHPEELSKSSTLQGQLNSIVEQRAKAASDAAIQHSIALSSGDASGGRDSEAAFKLLDKGLSERESQARELLSLGKERDRKQDEVDRKGSGAAGKSFMDVFDAGVKERGEEREETAKEVEKAARSKAEADRKAAELTKRTTERKMSDEEQSLGKSQGGIDKDLDFTEKQLAHQRATSAVSIQGGLYGRNDSAAVLVQHAAQQVNLLRSIDANIKDIRAQREELTLA